MKKHAILIVEDEEELSQNYKIFCQMALSNLQDKGLNIEIEVLQAFTIDDAIKHFDSHHIDFMSLDLALQKDEGHLRDSDRKQGREAGGMAFLKRLREKNNRTNVIIVSGETLMSYSIDALQKYGVLGFYQKGELDAQNYITAVQAALWYQSALEVISKLENFETGPNDIEKAEKYWKNALEAAVAANINPNSFTNPEARIVSIRSKLDKETGVPSNEWVEKALIRNILHCPEWSLFQVEVTNLSAFENAHASQVEPLSFYIVGQLKEMPRKFNFDDMFIGKYHFGHREAFIVVCDFNIREKGQQIANWLQNDFKKDAPNFTPFVFGSDENLPAPVIPELGIKTWYSDLSEFTDVQQIIDALGDDLP